MARVDLSSSAQEDLRKLLKTPAGAAITSSCTNSLLILAGRSRCRFAGGTGHLVSGVRAGEFRIVLRPLNAAECKARSVAKGYLVKTPPLTGGYSIQRRPTGSQRSGSALA